MSPVEGPKCRSSGTAFVLINGAAVQEHIECVVEVYRRSVLINGDFRNDFKLPNTTRRYRVMAQTPTCIPNSLTIQTQKLFHLFLHTRAASWRSRTLRQLCSMLHSARTRQPCRLMESKPDMT